MIMPASVGILILGTLAVAVFSHSSLMRWKAKDYSWLSEKKRCVNEEWNARVTSEQFNAHQKKAKVLLY